MFKLYTISKKKTGILGIWKDKEGKIYRDKILIKEFYTFAETLENIFQLFSQGEKAVFYTEKSKVLSQSEKDFCYIEKIKAFIRYNTNHKIFKNPIYDNDENQESFKHCITWKENKLKPSLIKDLLVQHGGLTIFKNEKDYTLEIWK